MTPPEMPENDDALPENEAAQTDAEILDAEEGLESAADLPLSPEEEILDLEEKLAKMRDQLLRTLADNDNVRKRAERERADARIYAIEKFAGDLLGVFDNLDRAQTSISDDVRATMGEAGTALMAGLELTQNEFVKVMARHGVTAVVADAGDAFDPNLHQAVTQIPSEHPSGRIAQNFQIGWQIGNRVLRAAMVAVSTGPA